MGHEGGYGEDGTAGPQERDRSQRDPRMPRQAPATGTWSGAVLTTFATKLVLGFCCTRREVCYQRDFRLSRSPSGSAARGHALPRRPWLSGQVPVGWTLLNRQDARLARTKTSGIERDRESQGGCGEPQYDGRHGCHGSHLLPEEHFHATLHPLERPKWSPCEAYINGRALGLGLRPTRRLTLSSERSI